MSILFAPKKIGNVLIKNRFVHSACEDNLADKTGAVTDANIRKVRSLARGEVGLIIWTHLAVHSWGRTKLRQAGIFDDAMIPGLKAIVDTVHQEEGKIAFQLGHAGNQTSKEIISRKPMRPDTMSEEEIQEMIDAFVEASARAVEAGADAIQFHAAHGYLINQFLSPFYNKRTDGWGGSEENRFQFIREVVVKTNQKIQGTVPLLVKLNADDHIADDGIKPSLAAVYAKELAGIGISGVEVSGGSSFRSPWAICRGDIPRETVVEIVPETKKDTMKAWLEMTSGDYDLKGPYNLSAAKSIRSKVGQDISVLAVGGWRSISEMETAVQNGETDFISMCRPFIREPHLVKYVKEGKKKELACINCNRCFAALIGEAPVRCYHKGISPGDEKP